MSWAKERALAIVMGRVFGTVDKTPLVEVIAAELQRVADECVEVADEIRGKFIKIRNAEPNTEMDRKIELTDKALGAIDVLAAIRAKFPKEGQ